MNRREFAHLLGGISIGLLIAAMLASCIAARATATAPRSAPMVPASRLVPVPVAPSSGRTGAPEASGVVSDPWPGMDRTGGAPTPPAVASSHERTSPRIPARGARPGRLVASGTASFVDPSYGPLYLALPMSLGGRGRLVRICLDGRCVTRRSTDAGPVPSLHRVADLSYRDAAYLCGCDPWVPGLLRGVEVFGL